MGMAARMGDPTAHGGTIVVGCPTVLIGGMPAARVGDNHVCPMLNPGVPPPPHVGGPIVLGSFTVLIGGMPAARMGDMVTCAGPPDTIMMGCPTVMIGEAGSGSASGGGAGSSGAGSASASAKTALSDNVESTTKEKNWIEFEFVDKAGNQVSGVPYKFTDTDSKDSHSLIRTDGKIRRDALKEGECKVQLFNVSNAKWSKDKANVGEKVKLSAKTEGFEDNTVALIQIYRRDIKGADFVIDNIECKVKGGKIDAEWEYLYPENGDEENNDETVTGYSSPIYYFEVVINNLKARSGILNFKDFVEIYLKDENGSPLGNKDYILTFSNGTVRKGKLDSNGYKKEENIPAAHWSVSFPDLVRVFKR